MDNKKLLGKRIKELRKNAGYTQEKLAEIVEIEINSISSIERGRYFPSPENLVKISTALNVSLSDLFNFSEKTTCADFEKEILSNLSLLKNDKTKLGAINSFIKSILTI